MNEKKIRKLVKQAIMTAPTTTTYSRIEYKSDGRGGRIKVSDSPIEVGTFTGLLDNTSKSAITQVVSEAGKISNWTTPTLYVLCDNVFDPRKGDLIEADGKRYRFVTVTNILELNIIWQITLEIVGDSR